MKIDDYTEPIDEGHFEWLVLEIAKVMSLKQR